MTRRQTKYDRAVAEAEGLQPEAPPGNPCVVLAGDSPGNT